jgi:tRNA-modifying protein YgfZ
MVDPVGGVGVLASPTALALHPGWGTIRVTGDERLTWLQGLVTSDVAQLDSGRATWGLFLAKVGKCLSEVLVLAAPNTVWLGVPSSRIDAVLDHLDTFLVMEDAEVELVSDLEWLSLFGPKAESDSSELVRAFPRFSQGSVIWGEGRGVVLVGPAASRDEVIAHVVGRGGHLLSDAELRAFRIEHFMPEFGVDFDERHNPHDASIERSAVSWEKGCYLGQEAVCMLDMRGKVRRRLVSLRVEGASVSAADEVRDGEGEVVGEVTSSTPSFTGSIAFARIRASVAVEGTDLSVNGAPARVVRGPGGAA